MVRRKRLKTGVSMADQFQKGQRVYSRQTREFGKICSREMPPEDVTPINATETYIVLWDSGRRESLVDASELEPAPDV